ncbi:hypothetical protein RchiOBHm_Chr4g0397421 [Rosa chinensis]|uniref:Uncharacterized protein n=1 Tax=Rosa chinensis TaxID=74649 RepID=A0A2P6QS17_ROSCH|nr:hypothetical protein RchiOBHm_Chr4g0397421 [Rosa chinensis]
MVSNAALQIPQLTIPCHKLTKLNALVLGLCSNKQLDVLLGLRQLQYLCLMHHTPPQIP